MSNVQRFGAVGDGQTDDTKAIEHAVQDGDGILNFPRGDYLISRPIVIPLEERNRFAIDGVGGTAKIIMAGAGPAFHFIGTHSGTADPGSFEDRVWQRQRLPMICNIEIEGQHEEATGILMEGVMQPTLQGVLLRRLQDGIRFTGRCRNVVISECHIYHNRRVGIFFDKLNLHQAIISASHISYNPVAGIKVSDTEIRNLQITGNDIEYNYSKDLEDSADILIDCTTPGATVREVTISSNTIQARYSPNGANVRLIGLSPEENQHVGMTTISGNIIGSQETNVHLKSCRGVVVTGNVIYSGMDRNLVVENSRNIIVGSNSFEHNPGYRDKAICTGVRITESENLQFTGCSIQDSGAGETTVSNAKSFPRYGLMEVVRSNRIGISGSQFFDGAPCGLFLDECSNVLVNGSTVSQHEATNDRETMIRWLGTGQGNMITGCHLGRGAGEPLVIDDQAGVKLYSNLIDG